MPVSTARFAARWGFLLLALTIAGRVTTAADPPSETRNRRQAPPDSSPGRPPDDSRPRRDAGPPGGFGPGMFIAPRILDLADADNDGKLSPAEAGDTAARLVRERGNATQGGLNTESLTQVLIDNLEPPPGALGEGGPFAMLAGRLFKALDADNDGVVSPEEAASAAKKFVNDADAGHKGSLDEDALARGINRLLGPPPDGPGGPMAPERKLLKQFDKNGDRRLDRDERLAAREAIKKEKSERGGRGFGPPGGFGRRADAAPPQPGPRLDPNRVEKFSGEPLYSPRIVRTLFLDFDDSDWEAEMADFYHSDVEMPATLTVDGRKYPGVGVHFRGLSSFGMVGAGQKRSLNVSMDETDSESRLYGYKTLNLLNSHEDPSFLHTVLYLEIARHYLPAPKANFVRVAINGESWGLYVNAQQFDKKFVAENFSGSDGAGARWKVKGNPGGGGGLDYLGDNVQDYQKHYELKSKDNPDDWQALITLCKTLSQTPATELEAALEPMLDIDGLLWFLALDNALVNSDGYWIRASDYSIYREPQGKFHILPHDANETLSPGGGPGFGGPPGAGRGGDRQRPDGGPRDFAGPPGGQGDAGRQLRAAGPAPRGSGIEIDPLVGLDDPRKPLRSKVLTVPNLKRQYLEHVRTIANDWLDWSKLGPIVASYREQIAADVKADTRKLESFEAFEQATADTAPGSAAPGDTAAPKADPNRAESTAGPAPSPGGPQRRAVSLRSFAEQRRKYLLDYPAIKALSKR